MIIMEEVVVEVAQPVRIFRAQYTGVTPPRGCSTPSLPIEPKWRPKRMPVQIFLRISSSAASPSSNFFYFEIHFLPPGFPFWWWATNKNIKELGTKKTKPDEFRNKMSSRAASPTSNFSCFEIWFLLHKIFDHSFLLVAATTKLFHPFCWPFQLILSSCTK